MVVDEGVRGRNPLDLAEDYFTLGRKLHPSASVFSIRAIIFIVHVGKSLHFPKTATKLEEVELRFCDGYEICAVDNVIFNWTSRGGQSRLAFSYNFT